MRKQTSEVDRIRRGVLSWTAVGLLGTALGIAKWLIVSRSLSSVEIGAYALLSVYAQFGGRFGGLGMSSALLHFDDLNEAQLNTALLSVIAVSVAIVATFLGGVVGWEGTTYLPEFTVISVAFVLRGIDEHFHSLNARQERHQVNAAANALGIVLGEGGAIALVLLDPTVMSLVIGQVVVVGVPAFAKTGYQAVVVGRRFTRLASLGAVAHLYRFSVWQLGGGLANLLSARIDRLVLASGFGLATVGYFEIATQMAMRPYQFVGTVVGQVLTPALSNRKHDHARVNAVYLELREILVALQLPVYTFLFVHAGLVMRVVYGVDEGFATEALRALAVLGFAKALVNPIGAYAVALGWPRAEVLINLISGGAYLVLLLTGILAESSTVAVWAYGIGGAICLLALDARVRRRVTQMPRGRIVGLGRSAGLSLFAAVGLSLLAVDRLAGAADYSRVAAATAVYALVYGLAERHAIRRMMNRFWRKPDSSAPQS